jgi:hypothetical protein
MCALEAERVAREQPTNELSALMQNVTVGLGSTADASHELVCQVQAMQLGQAPRRSASRSAANRQ